MHGFAHDGTPLAHMYGVIACIADELEARGFDHAETYALYSHMASDLDYYWQDTVNETYIRQRKTWQLQARLKELLESPDA